MRLTQAVQASVNDRPIVGLLAFSGAILASLFCAFQPATARGQESSQETTFSEPLSPQASLRSLRIAERFRVELVASEPLVRDPVAIAWGPDGKLWVVEMGDYPQAKRGTGRIRYLLDRDGDGRFDESKIFLSDLPAPSSVLPWRNGVLIAAAPEVFYAEDRDGDGQADRRIKILSGFNRGNPQHQVNSLSWGLDNWVHGANGDLGGVVRSVKRDVEVDIHQKDFRFHPDSGGFELKSGMSQFTHFRDDFGEWFGGNSAWPVWHCLLPDRYLARNPHWAPPEPCVYATDPEANPPVYPISPEQLRFNEFGQEARITAACGAGFYRDDVLGQDLRGDVFICEPAYNLIHRRKRTRQGLFIGSERVTEETSREFLASSDPWFRPVQIRTGPDGALYVVDMYRLIIEHPDFFDQIPDAVKKSPGVLRRGEDRGRIYRIVPEGKQVRDSRTFRGDALGDVLKALASCNGVRRDLAHQWLVNHRQVETASHVETLLVTAAMPEVRAQALATLAGLERLTQNTILKALEDRDPRVRRLASRFAESRLDDETVYAAICRLTNDVDASVRLQAALSIGESTRPQAGEVLARFAAKHIDEPYFVAAAISSGDKHARRMLAEIIRLRPRSRKGGQLVGDLLSIAFRTGQNDVVAAGLQSLSSANEDALWRIAVLEQFLDTLDRHVSSLSDLMESDDTKLRAAVQGLEALFTAARSIAGDPESSLDSRRQAVRVLGRGAIDQGDDLRLLARLTDAQVDPRLQRTAIETLGVIGTEDSAKAMLSDWPSRSPFVRERILGELLSRREGASLLLDAVEDGRIPGAHWPPEHRRRLTMSYYQDIRQRAAVLLGPPETTQRAEVVARYRESLTRRGDAGRGAALFRKHCVVCHREGEQAAAQVGPGPGPPLSALTSLTREKAMTAILFPNDSVDPRYLGYLIMQRNGRITTGVIAGESGSAIRIAQADGRSIAVLRSDIEQLKATGKSLMPDGFDRLLAGPEELADILAFLKQADG